MSVNAGQPVTDAVVNAAFLSRLENSDTEGIVGLKNLTTGSGPIITNVQAAINAAKKEKYAEQVITAGGTVDFVDNVGVQIRPIKSSGGNITLSSTPFGASVPSLSSEIVLVGLDSTDTVTMTNSDVANGVALNGDITLSAGTIIRLIYISDIQRFVEISRNGL